ncbi:MAG: hypothetical protein WBV79_15770, partial [Rhodomicrobium sp.]
AMGWMVFLAGSFRVASMVRDGLRPPQHEAEQSRPSGVNLMVSLSNHGLHRFLGKVDPNVCVALHRKMQRW